MSFELNGYEWVSPEASGRRGGYWRKIPDTRTNPTVAQAQHRLKFAEVAVDTRGLCGTVPTSDGRQVSKSAVALGEILRSDELCSADIPVQVEEIPKARVTATTQHIKDIAAQVPKAGPQDALFNALIHYAAAERERREAELKKERQLWAAGLEKERERTNLASEKSQKAFEERMKRISAFAEKRDAEWSKIEKRIEEIQRKLEEKQAPPITKVLDTPHSIQDISTPPSENSAWWHVPAILGSFILGTATVAYALQGPKQADNVRNALGLVRQIAHTK